MKFKKLGLIASLIPLLMACNNNSVAGVYGFQLGKESGSHFGLFLTLTDDEYDLHPEIVGYKKLSLAFSMSLTDGEETYKELSSILDIFKDENGRFVLDGYYKLTGEWNKSNEERISLGLEFTYMIQQFAGTYEEITGTSLTDEMKNTLNALNNQNLIESLIYATRSGEQVNTYIPVSLDDAYYQLYWYGYDVQVKLPKNEDGSDFYINVANVTKHDLGTKPTQEDVDSINETFADTHTGYLFTKYRAYNALKLSLGKK